MYGGYERSPECAGVIEESNYRDAGASFMLSLEWTNRLEQVSRQAAIEQGEWGSRQEVEFRNSRNTKARMQLNILLGVIQWECPSCQAQPGLEFVDGMGYDGTPVDEIPNEVLILASILAMAHGRMNTSEFLSQFHLGTFMKSEEEVPPEWFDTPEGESGRT